MFKADGGSFGGLKIPSPAKRVGSADNVRRSSLTSCLIREGINFCLIARSMSISGSPTPGIVRENVEKAA